MLNGYDGDLARSMVSRFTGRGLRKQGRHIWDPEIEQAELVAKICRIDNVPRNMEDMIGRVDGVIVSDDTTMKHQ